MVVTTLVDTEHSRRDLLESARLLVVRGRVHMRGGTGHEAPGVEDAGSRLVRDDSLLRGLRERANGVPTSFDHVDQEREADGVEPMMGRQLRAHVLQLPCEVPRLPNAADGQVRADRAQEGLGQVIGVAEPASDREQSWTRPRLVVSARGGDTRRPSRLIHTREVPEPREHRLDLASGRDGRPP